MTGSEEKQSERPQWSGRVPRFKIVRLYTADAKGIVDEELIDEIGYALFARCEDILRATEAHQGRASCPHCGQVILHRWGKKELLHCAHCAWELSWEEYHRSYRKKHLHAGGMEPFIRAFVADFAKARTPREKMILIDLLLHRYHGELQGNAHRPGAINLIGGEPSEIRVFLDELGHGRTTDPESRNREEAWVERSRGERGGWQRDP